MTTTFCSPSKRAFIVRKFNKIENCSEVCRRFYETFRRLGPSHRGVKKLLAKANKGNLLNLPYPRFLRTVRTGKCSCVGIFLYFNEIVTNN